MARKKFSLFGAATLIFAVPMLMATADGGWMRHVPERDRAQMNPYAGDQEAALAGSLIYRRSCASCHGDDATGRGNRPSLRTQRVHEATDGELAWLLNNGDMRNGMPSWSRLPEAQRWQVVRYLKTLPIETAQK